MEYWEWSIAHAQQLLPAYEDGTVGVVHDVIADAAQEGAPELAHPASPAHDQHRLLFLSYSHNGLPWVSLFRHEFGWFLQNEEMFKSILCNTQNYQLSSRNISHFIESHWDEVLSYHLCLRYKHIIYSSSCGGIYIQDPFQACKVCSMWKIYKMIRFIETNLK